MPAGQPTLLFVGVLALGATVVDDRRKPNDRGWVVFADPAGNEFCVEASAAERAG